MSQMNVRNWKEVAGIFYHSLSECRGVIADFGGRLKKELRDLVVNHN